MNVVMVLMVDRTEKDYLESIVDFKTLKDEQIQYIIYNKDNK